MQISLFSSAIVGILVGFGSSIAIVIAGAQAVGANPVQVASWVSAICLGTGVASIVLSLRHRLPMITAWSTPGAALIAGTASAGIPSYSMEAAVGAFLVTALLVLVSSAFRPLTTLIERIPSAIASAMLAGVLIGFSVDVFDAATMDPKLVLPLVGVFLVVRLYSPTWAVIVVLVMGIGWAVILGKTAPYDASGSLAAFALIVPSFEPGAILGLGVPLFLVSMASQNLPGFAVLRASGYSVPTRSALAITGLMSLLTAPLGAHTTTMSSITASICTGVDTHPDPSKRWLSGLFYGTGFLVLAVAAVTVVAGFSTLPPGVIATVAGLALLGPLMHALGAALAPEQTRFAAVLTVTVTASGLSVFGVGSAFWGLVFGLLAVGLDLMMEGRST
ncbi:MAG: benzoate transporter [Alphaproteobacteria bacterium]|nr:benzoate transporter [Alphaproteobacteria bacterium]